MKKKIAKKTVLILMVFLSVCSIGNAKNILKKESNNNVPSEVNKAEKQNYSAYLMAYFNPEEKLYYAYSCDAKNWTALNNGQPVFDSGVRLRDPFINRVNGKSHLVHTKIAKQLVEHYK